MKENPKDFHEPWSDNPWMVKEANDWISWIRGLEGFEEAGSDAGINFFVSCSRQPDVALARLITLIHCAGEDEQVLDAITCGPSWDFIHACPEEFHHVVKTVARQQPKLSVRIDLDGLSKTA